MAVPKKKVSKASKNSRKANWSKVSAPSLCECPHCHEMKQTHKVCAKCGYYDGEEIVAKKEAK